MQYNITNESDANNYRGIINKNTLDNTLTITINISTYFHRFTYIYINNWYIYLHSKCLVIS